MGKILNRYRLEYQAKKDRCIGGTHLVIFPVWCLFKWNSENSADFFDDNYHELLHKAYKEDRELAQLLHEVLNACSNSVRADGGRGSSKERQLEAWAHDCG